VTEIVTETLLGDALVLVPPPAADVEDDELHAAAARHKASDADATTAPFLAIGIM